MSNSGETGSYERCIYPRCIVTCILAQDTVYCNLYPGTTQQCTTEEKSSKLWTQCSEDSGEKSGNLRTNVHSEDTLIARTDCAAAAATRPEAESGGRGHVTCPMQCNVHTTLTPMCTLLDYTLMYTPHTLYTLQTALKPRYLMQRPHWMCTAKFASQCDCSQCTMPRAFVRTLHVSFQARAPPFSLGIARG